MAVFQLNFKHCIRQSFDDCTFNFNHIFFKPTTVEGTCDRCGGHEFYQRDDDKPETVKNRLAVNIKNSEPILAYYKEQGLLKSIDGNRDIDAVFKDVQAIID